MSSSDSSDSSFFSSFFSSAVGTKAVVSKARGAGQVPRPQCIAATAAGASTYLQPGRNQQQEPQILGPQR